MQFSLSLDIQTNQTVKQIMYLCLIAACFVLLLWFKSSKEGINVDIFIHKYMYKQRHIPLLAGNGNDIWLTERLPVTNRFSACFSSFRLCNPLAFRFPSGEKTFKGMPCVWLRTSFGSSSSVGWLGLGD